MTERTADAKALDKNWPPPPFPDDVAKAVVEVMQDVVNDPSFTAASDEAFREESLRTVVEDAKTLVQIAKLMDTLEPYAQRATLDWLRVYYDEVC